MSQTQKARETVVLLVEDDRDDFFLTQDILHEIKREPHRVVWAASYDAAKLELDEREFDVALVDYRIDGRTGLEFISQVGSLYPHCPMILLTGLQDPGLDLAAQEAGAVDYLAKDSLTPDLLERTIRYARANTRRFAFLDRILSSAAAGVVNVDANGMPDLWNRKAIDALGIALPRNGRLTGGAVREALERIKANGKLPEEFKSSDERAFQITVTPGPDGSTVIAMHDISSRARSEALLRQAAAAAEAASQAKSSFLATMSHELRTPLNGILGMTRVLSQSNLDETQRDQLSVIRASGESLLQIINDILDLSKIEAGKVELDEAEFEIEPIVDDVVKLLAPTAFGKGLEIAAFVDPFLPQSMLGDALRIKQILTNLVGNAVKFTTDGSVVMLVTHEMRDGEPSIHFTVSDTGCGVEPDKIDLLFKRFSQVDSSNTRRHSGTGLGLALCKELTRLMNGQIWYEPGDISGSTFHLRLGLKREPEAVTKARLAATEAAAGGRIVALTASQPVASILECYAEVMKVSMIWAGSTREAVSAIQQNQVEAILIDARMDAADMRGLVAAARRPGAPKAPALILIDDYPAKGPKAGTGGVPFEATLQRPFGLGAIDVLGRVLKRMAEPPKAVQQAVARPVAPKGRLCILMAEDNGPNRLVAAALLRSAGYDIEIAEDGVEAVEKALGRRYDVILMDVQMPRIDGLEATRRIRAHDRLRHTPIIGLSAGAMKKDREDCMAAGMTDYIPKPVDWDRLLALLEQIEKASKRSATSAA